MHPASARRSTLTSLGKSRTVFAGAALATGGHFDTRPPKVISETAHDAPALPRTPAAQVIRLQCRAPGRRCGDPPRGDPRAHRRERRGEVDVHEDLLRHLRTDLRHPT